MDLYEKSLLVREIYNLSRKIDCLHLYRYGFFVDNSEKGRECKYALLTEKQELLERNKMREELILLRDKINKLLES